MAIITNPHQPSPPPIQIPQTRYHGVKKANSGNDMFFFSRNGNQKIFKILRHFIFLISYQKKIYF
jgi:hypothetical protein